MTSKIEAHEHIIKNISIGPTLPPFLLDRPELLNHLQDIYPIIPFMPYIEPRLLTLADKC
jgi:hypothetical protein